MSLELPRTLSPSKIAAFTNCPLAFRLSYIDKLADKASRPAVLGTLVHRALELLYREPPAGRDETRATGCLAEAFAEMYAGDPELAALDLDDAGREALVLEAAGLVRSYFEMEDPTAVTAAGLEVDLSAEIDGVVLRSYIDRLDLLEDGGLSVVDYKTGKAPRTSDMAGGKLGGVHLYAMLCEEILGVRPAEVRLLYLKDQVTVTAEPSPTSIRGVRLRAGGVWKAIERACEREDFRPKPSKLCDWCGYRDQCPAFQVRD